MGRLRTVSYNPDFHEAIVTEGIDGLALTWIGIDIDAQILHIVAKKGIVDADGNSIEHVTKTGQQQTHEGQAVVDFYVANKEVVDAYLTACANFYLVSEGKTGILNT